MATTKKESNNKREWALRWMGKRQEMTIDCEWTRSNGLSSLSAQDRRRLVFFFPFFLPGSLWTI
jgi:hypothetical protein